MNFQKYENKGLSGLANIGNTCYLNSCMQVLSHTYELNEFLDNSNYMDHIHKNKYDSIILAEWDKLRKMLWSKNCGIIPKGFFSAVQLVASKKNIDLFEGFSQNDVQEYLLFIFDCFHNSISTTVKQNQYIFDVYEKKDNISKKCFEMIENMYKNDFSPFLNIYFGIQVSKICEMNNEDNCLSVSPEPFFVLSLQIPCNIDSPTIEECFDEYCENEELSGDNAWFNENTKKKQDITKCNVFWKLPHILIVQLKRWNFNGKKNRKMVDTPITDLDLSDYVVSKNENEKYIYDLYGVCNHSGTSNGGHYTANIKNANGKWYNFNDLSIREISESEVITQNAYCLFYRKKI